MKPLKRKGGELSLFCAKIRSKVEAIRISVIGYLIFYQVSRVKHGTKDRSAVKVLICVYVFVFQLKHGNEN